jgi:hypothetical protein
VECLAFPKDYDKNTHYTGGTQMPFLTSFLTYLIIMIVLMAVAVAGIFAGKALASKKALKSAEEEIIKSTPKEDES